jgi:diguanylate cyclase (GGDEF)-like protein
MNKRRKVTIGSIIIFLCLALIIATFFIYGNITEKNNRILYKISHLEAERTMVNLLLQETLFSKTNVYSTYSAFSSAYSAFSQELIELIEFPFINKLILESATIQQSKNVLLNLMNVNKKRMLEIDDQIAQLREKHVEYIPGPFNAQAEQYHPGNSNTFQLGVQLQGLPIYHGGAWDISFKKMIEEVRLATTRQTFIVETISVVIVILLGFFIFILTKIFCKIFDQVDDLSKNLEKEVALRSAELNKILYELSITDELTGLYNRRHFNTNFENGWMICVREKKPISVIMIDIDYFKSYNDYYGHVAGDVALSGVASVIKKSLNRVGDIAARYGGEEFIVVLPNTDLNGSFRVAQNIKNGIANFSLEHSKSPVSSVLTVSMGVATTHPSIDDNATDLIRNADGCLYRAKENGRDRIVKIEQN